VSEPDAAAVRREINARRRAQALQMRREGATFDAIASRMGVTRGAARKMVAREVRSLSNESPPEERRLIHAEALMDLWRVLHGPASQGDMAAIDRFLRVEERLARLLGLDRQPPHEADERPADAAGRSDRAESSPDDDEDEDVPRRFRRQPAGVTAGHDIWSTGERETG
jgi:hypothetical protein